MRNKTKSLFTLLLCGLCLSVSAAYAAEKPKASDLLPSWNDGKTKQAIIQFVEDVTKQGGPHYVQMT